MYSYYLIYNIKIYISTIIKQIIYLYIIIYVMNKYYKTRIYITEDEQTHLEVEKVDIGKIELFELKLKEQIDKYEIFITRRENSANLLLFDGKYDDIGNIKSFKISFEKKVKIFSKDYILKSIHLKSKDSFPFLNVKWDSTNQYLLIEKNTSVVKKLETVIKSLQELFDVLFLSEKYTVHINTVSIPSHFWNIIEENKYIYSFKLKLDNPNLFGDTHASIRDMTLRAKSEVNSDSIEVGGHNTKGELKIPSNEPNSFISSAIEWITAGGGEWSIEYKKDDKGRKDKATSSNPNYVVEEDEKNT